MNKKSYREQFNEEGFVVIPKLISGNELQQILNACNRILDKYTSEMESKHPGRDFFRLNGMHNPKWIDSPEDLKSILELGADPRCLGTVEHIFGVPSLFRTTNFWVNPKYKSEEGNWHRDTQFVCNEEEEEKLYIQKLKEEGFHRSIQFQIALVDSSDLEYVPYSVQRYDSPEEYYIRLADDKIHCRDVQGMPNAMRFHLKAGDAILLNPAGLHRGRYHADKLRRTLMYTYTPAYNLLFDSISNQPWFLNEEYLNHLSPRATTYYKEYIKVYKDHWAQMQQSATSSTVDSL
jgi:hypothetical protein